MALTSALLFFRRLNCNKASRIHILHRRTQDFTMEGFTWWGPGQGVWGTEVSSGIKEQTPGIGGLGDFVPQKLKQHVKLAYDF